MGANLRWDLELVRNPVFVKVLEHAYQTIEGAGLVSGRFRTAYDQYKADVLGGVGQLSTAGTVMNGFMLGQWLHLQESGTRHTIQC